MAEEKLYGHTRKDAEDRVNEYLRGLLDVHREELKYFLNNLFTRENLGGFFDYLDAKARHIEILDYLNRDYELEFYDSDEEIAYHRMLELKELAQRGYRRLY